MPTIIDSSSILYYECHEGAGKVMAVGPLFNIQYYGFMFSEGSKLREPVNRTLLKLKENGSYDGIYDKWFGKVGRYTPFHLRFIFSNGEKIK